MAGDSDDDWLRARLKLLEKEKQLTRLRDEVAEARREMPWRPVDTVYEFKDERGSHTLGDLFADKSQLVVYHYMFGPDWEEGCKSCSFWADQYDALEPHLGARDVALAAVSRADWRQFQEFKKRMGWRFTWVSSAGTSFNSDFHVSFPGASEGVYNYRHTGVREELPGLSVFIRDASGSVFHTYSCYSRGLDSLNAAYQVLDLVPQGRNEENLPFPMAWVNFHDRYE